MPTFGFLIDNRKCIGCHACTVACKSEHEVPIGVDRTWVKYIEKGTFPNTRRLFTVMRCNHCDWAPCVTICPVTALYRRDDGVIDFNSDRCIGCKACLQACPYDALYIDPVTDTAAKCNFCTHRLEQNLEPSCVVVCPERAIVCGDLDDPNSEISRLTQRHPVQVRKPEKGTRPKLFYIDADEASLVPSRTAADGQYVWSDGGVAGVESSSPQPNLITAMDTAGGSKTRPQPTDSGNDHTLAPARRAYDVRPRPELWGWAVVGYIWAKSIAAGSFLAVLAVRLMADLGSASRLALPLGCLALLFLIVTLVLLVADLKQPKRFLFVLLRPQWKSWLVRGAYILVGYSIVLVLWIAASAADWSAAAEILFWPGVVLAVLAAVYTAFLLAQAKGRDLWQNALLSVHLLAHAVVAGGAVWLLTALVVAPPSTFAARMFMAITVVFSLLALLGELATAPPTDDARLAIRMIVGRPMGMWFWAGGIGAGHIAPLVLLLTIDSLASGAAALLALFGMGVIERLWILAPQRVPLS